MSDTSTPTPAAAPTSAPTTPAAITPPAQPTAAAPPATEAQATEPGWIQARIERERRATLAKLGIKVPKKGDPDAVIAEVIAKNESRKEERKALKQRVSELEGQVSNVAGKDAALKVYAETALADLDEKSREAVKRVAGEDPAEILKQVSFFKMSGIAAQAPAATPAPINPATTTPSGTPPAAAGSVPADDVKAQYAALKASGNPLDLFKAQMLAADHAREILGK